MKLSKKQFHAVYGNRRKMLRGRNYYLIESTGPAWSTIESHPKLWAKIALTLAMPIVFLVYGIANCREVWGEYLDVIFSKKRGAYPSDPIKQETVDKIKSL